MFKLRLCELMKENNLTKAKIVRATGITEGAIDGWIKRGAQPTAEMIIKLADYFEVSTDYLLGRSNDLGIVQTNANLTQFENMLLSVVGKLSRDDQFQVLGFAQALAK